MKNLLGYILLFVFPFSLLSQIEVTQVKTVSDATLGVSYYLPKTTIIIDITVLKETFIPGEFAQFAERFLGIKAETGAISFSHKIEETKAYLNSSVDKDQMFLISSIKNRPLPELFFTQSGLLHSINEVLPPFVEPVIPILSKNTVIDNFTTDAKTLLGEEVLTSGSSLKMAELVAKQILSIRETKNDILTGQADQMPKDGAAIKFVIEQLNEKERKLSTLFWGSKQTEILHYRYEVEPISLEDKRVLFRFSTRLGVLDSEDLAGYPIEINFSVSKPKPQQPLTEKEMKKIDTKGFVYLDPSTVQFTLLDTQGEIYRNRFIMTQFGQKIGLSSQLFSDPKTKIKARFNPLTGRLEKIAQ